ncbi:DUF2569 family protein [Achromobacter anxifer]
MAMQEGVRRIVKVLSVLAWAVLALSMVLSVAVLFGREPGMTPPVLGAGVAAFGIFQGGAWILAGFSGNPPDADGLVRWGNLPFRRRPAAKLASVSVGPVGVGGWLWLPIIGLLILGPLMSIGQTLQALEEAERLYPALLRLPAWSSYKTAGWTIIATACAVSIVAGYRLLKDLRPQTITLTIVALWFRGPITSVLDAAAGQAFLGYSIVEYFSDPRTLGSVLAATVTALIWTLYFKWSRRVRNTYFGRMYPANTPKASQDRAEPSL